MTLANSIYQLERIKIRQYLLAKKDKFNNLSFFFLPINYQKPPKICLYLFPIFKKFK